MCPCVGCACVRSSVYIKRSYSIVTHRLLLLLYQWVGRTLSNLPCICMHVYSRMLCLRHAICACACMRFCVTQRYHCRFSIYWRRYYRYCFLLLSLLMMLPLPLPLLDFATIWLFCVLTHSNVNSNNIGNLLSFRAFNIYYHHLTYSPID